MFKLSAIIFFTTFVATVISGFLFDGVKEFQFTKSGNDSSKFDFHWVEQFFFIIFLLKVLVKQYL